MQEQAIAFPRAPDRTLDVRPPLKRTPVDRDDDISLAKARSFRLGFQFVYFKCLRTDIKTLRHILIAVQQLVETIQHGTQGDRHRDDEQRGEEQAGRAMVPKIQPRGGHCAILSLFPACSHIELRA
jgi:hypothetical protein